MVRRAVGVGRFRDLDEPAPNHGLQSGRASVIAHLYKLVMGEGSV